jgi:hypothetical protein
VSTYTWGKDASIILIMKCNKAEHGHKSDKRRLASVRQIPLSNALSMSRKVEAYAKVLRLILELHDV